MARGSCSSLSDTARAMSQADIETLRTLYEAFNRGDWDAAFRNAPGLELKTAEQVTNPGTYRGPKAVRQIPEDVIVETEEFLARGDRILVLLLWRSGSMGSSAVLENRIGHLWTMRDGKPVRCEIFPDPEMAREALGLSEQDAHADF